MQRHLDPWLLGILALTAILGVYQLDWGLPNHNTSWAADALGPLTVLSIARRSFTSWNTGWFYFKYPLGYPFLLLAVNAPYLGWLLISGDWRNPSSLYPYGFADPERALYIMTLIGRASSVVLVMATVALTYGIGRRLLGRLAGRLAAWFVATAYPIVYYAHTTNLDAAYLFWLTLALWATVVATETPVRWAYVTLGVAAAMAMSTKEQGYAFLLSLPVILVLYGERAQPRTQSVVQRGWKAVWNPGTRAGLIAAVLTMLLAGNAFMNPSGMVNRFLNLSGRHVEGVAARLTPVSFALFKGAAKEQQYLHQLVDAMESSLGLPLLLVAALGVVHLSWQRSRATLCLLLPVAAYYFVSLRTHDLIQLRYTLPMIVLGALAAAAVLAASAARWPGPAAVVISVLAAFGLVRAVELDLLLRNDSRYAAEAWMRTHLAPGTTVESYQKPVYLPRFDGMAARFVPLSERSIAAIEARRPDVVVTSSAAKKGITHRWNPDWRRGNTLLVEAPPATALLQALERGDLPYRQVASFTQQPTTLRVRITSLCPTITVYQRTDVAAADRGKHGMMDAEAPS
jgi:4-amino-4-deoxy-L-arabinose transferase-like glycosyltransferase